MTLPASGAISLYDVNVELGFSGTAGISLNDGAVRGLFGVASGAISLSDGYGKTRYPRPSSFSVTYATGGSTSNEDAPCPGGSGWAQVAHGGTGYPAADEGITYSGFGTGTFSGTLYMELQGSLVDSGGGIQSALAVGVNGTNIVTVNSAGTTPVTVTDQVYSMGYYSGVNLATFTVSLWVYGGKLTSGGGSDTCQAWLQVKSIGLE